MPRARDLPVAERMLQTRRLNAAQVAQAKQMAAKRGVSQGEALLLLRLASEDDVIATEAELTASRWMPAGQLAQQQAPGDVIARVPLETCLELRICPLALEAGQRFTVAMRDPSDRHALDRLLELGGGARVSGVRVGDKALDAVIDRHYRKVDEDDPSSWLER
jgi:hypothetical protein